MKQRGFNYQRSKTRISGKGLVFFFCLLFFFSFFSFTNNITNIFINKKPIDIFTNDLKRFAIYSRVINKDLGNFILNIDDIVQEYNQWKNPFLDKKKTIDNVWLYIATNKTTLQSRWFSKYHTFFNVVAEIYPYRQEVYELLGENKNTNYLALLQNVGEKRPNGWFFWSFAFLTLEKARVKEIGIVDTYFPNHVAPNTIVQAPTRSVPYLWTANIGFVAANKFWFTNMDGENIKKLYEKIFNEDYDIKIRNKTAYTELQKTLINKYIKGVVFLRTDMFEEIMPNLQKKIRERQFVNASIDLIRWEVRDHKKELYLNEVNTYFKENQEELIKAIINNFDKIISGKKINIYLSNTSNELNWVLEKYWLENNYQKSRLYLRDTNNAYNKSDRFITKEVVIQQQQKIIIHEFNNDIIDISTLKPWIYELEILYHLNIPNEYKKFIKELEKKYEIELTEREIWILWLWPTVNNIMRWTKGIVHFPSGRQVSTPKGNVKEKQIIQTDFSKAATYATEMNEENSTNIINIKFQISWNSRQ